MNKNNKMEGSMKKINKVFTKSSAIMVAISCFAPSIANATNGLFMIGYGTKSRGMGGVAIATPADSISATANPANLSAVGRQFDIGADFFTANVTGQLGSISNDSKVDLMGVDNLFIMPAMGVSIPLNNKYTLGFSMIPVGGGATQYDKNFYQAALDGTTDKELGVTLIVSQIHSTLAYKYNKQHSFGASFVVGVQVFRAKGIELFDTFTQTQGTNDGFSGQNYDWSLGAGLKFGWLGTFDKLKVGASYQTKTWMQKFDKYKELFAEDGDFDTPAILGVGINYAVTPKWSVAADVTYTFYEDVAAIANKGPNLAGNPAGPLGSDDRKLGLSAGLGFGWENQTVFKLGTEYQLSPKWIGRAGWNYGKSPIDEDTQIIFNLLAPAIAQHHLTLGGTYIVSPTMELNASFIHAFEFKQSGPTYVSDDGSNLGSLEMSQNSLGASLTYKF